MTTIIIEKAIVHRALSALEYHTQQTRPIHNTELVIEELRAALAAPATAPAQPERKHTEAEVDEWVAAFLKCSTNGEFREEARRILGVSHG